MCFILKWLPLWKILVCIENYWNRKITPYLLVYVKVKAAPPSYIFCKQGCFSQWWKTKNFQWTSLNHSWSKDNTIHQSNILLKKCQFETLNSSASETATHPPSKRTKLYLKLKCLLPCMAIRISRTQLDDCWLLMALIAVV